METMLWFRKTNRFGKNRNESKSMFSIAYCFSEVLYRPFLANYFARVITFILPVELPLCTCELEECTNAEVNEGYCLFASNVLGLRRIPSESTFSSAFLTFVLDKHMLDSSVDRVRRILIIMLQFFFIIYVITAEFMDCVSNWGNMFASHNADYYVGFLRKCWQWIFVNR